MSLSYTIDEAARLVWLRYEGEVTAEEFAATMRAVFADRRYGPGFSLLSDRLSAEVSSAEYARTAAEFLAQHANSFGGSRWATVVNSPVAFGIARMMDTLSDGLPVTFRVFTDLDAALAWLAEGRPDAA